ncbi:MAG: sugar transferase [Paracoccaceae bacterium]
MSYTFVEENPDGTDTGEYRFGLYAAGGKRVLDLVALIVILPIVMPLILLAWIVAMSHGSPGFYRQIRVGRNGKNFVCWKIRTMAPDADQKLIDLVRSDPNIAREWKSNQKLSNDPRITSFGKFLRSSSIDELPQIWNVFKGEMSLFGPRPFTPNQRALYDAAAPLGSYYTLRPGISGLWQVESRNTGEFCDRVNYDEEYARSVSLVSDIKIAFRTVAVVLKATGN